MDITSDWNGRLLAQVLSEAPSLTLSFYSYGILLRKQEGDRVSEYPVDAEQVALALSAKVRFDTGLLSDDTLLVRQEGAQRLVIAYRAPRKTGLFLEGSEHPLHVPLPALVLLRTVSDGQQPQYALYAVKNRPATLNESLFHAPLPNVFSSGNICWGTVPRASDAGLTGTSLAQDWDLLLGSRFGDHAANGKSKRYPSDIRKMWATLEARHARTYPKSDLLPVNKTLGQVIGEARA